MFHRGWFHISVVEEHVGFELAKVVQRFGTARVRLSCGKPDLGIDTNGRFAGVIVECQQDGDVEAVAELARRLPELPVLVLLRETNGAYINRLQALGVSVCVLPVFAPAVVAFVQRALASTFLPHDRVARLLSQVAHDRGLTAREVQILSYCLGDEPRARVRRRLGISENTLKTQIKGLLRKCEERNVDALAKNILRMAVLGDPVSTQPSSAPRHELRASA